MTMINLILVILYSIGFILTCKLFIKFAYKYWPYLGWDISDTIVCLVVGFVWPLTIIPLFISDLKTNKKNKNITIFPFKKWYDKEVNKNKA